MVLCWVDIDLRPDDFENSSTFGKCSRKTARPSDFKNNIGTGRVEGEPVSKLVRLILVSFDSKRVPEGFLF